MSRLTIKGDKNHYKEIIKLLKSLGGRDKDNIYNIGKNNFNEACLYAIRDFDKVIIGTYPSKDDVTYTYEEFIEEYPYKVGDKVCTIYGRTGIINALIWSKRDNCIKYELEADTDSFYFVNELQPHKEETMDRKYNVEEYLQVWKETEKGLEVVVNDKFELKEDCGKFYIIKKQPQYPKTYRECSLINGCEDRIPLKIIGEFIKLINARNAYWKIAGEQMGLGKAWKPDWTNANERKYCIVNTMGKVEKWVQKTTNKIFAFPTEEMRDAFYDNFKDLIEQCKELL